MVIKDSGLCNRGGLIRGLVACDGKCDYCIQARKCPNGLLPDGPICPECGESRAASGVDGGTWVHYPSTNVKSDLSKQQVTDQKIQPPSKYRLPPGSSLNLGDELSATFFHHLRKHGVPTNDARKRAKKQRLEQYVKSASNLEDLKLCLLEYMNRDNW
jgi:hypothetical protein